MKQYKVIFLLTVLMGMGANMALSRTASSEMVEGKKTAKSENPEKRIAKIVRNGQDRIHEYFYAYDDEGRISCVSEIEYDAQRRYGSGTSTTEYTYGDHMIIAHTVKYNGEVSWTVYAIKDGLIREVCVYSDYYYVNKGNASFAYDSDGYCSVTSDSFPYGWVDTRVESAWTYTAIPWPKNWFMDLGKEYGDEFNSNGCVLQPVGLWGRMPQYLPAKNTAGRTYDYTVKKGLVTKIVCTENNYGWLPNEKETIDITWEDIPVKGESKEREEVTADGGTVFIFEVPVVP